MLVKGQETGWQRQNFHVFFFLSLLQVSLFINLIIRGPDDFQYNSQSGGIFKKYLKRVSTPKGTRPFSHFSNICYIVIEIYVIPFTQNLGFYQYDCVTISKITSRVLFR